MTDLQKFPAQICLTAAGCLIHENKVLLVKHKKLGIWLNPGGHIEPNELPHQAAEREFWEETGLKVKAYDYLGIKSDDESEYVPNPFASNLHWVSKKNYETRQEEKAQGKSDYQKEKKWKKGCEQHVGFLYLVKPTAGVDFYQNVEETDGIAWFELEEMADLETLDNIRTEVKIAFELVGRKK